MSIFVFDGFPKDIVLDVDAIMRVLNDLSKLTQFSLRNLSLINADALDNLIDMACEIILREPRKLKELDFGGLGASPE